MELTFYAELKTVAQTKTVSLDNQYSLKLLTDDSNVLDLGKLSPDTLFKVTICVADK